MHVYFGCIGYTFLGALYACPRLCSFWHAVLSCGFCRRHGKFMLYCSVPLCAFWHAVLFGFSCMHWAGVALLVGMLSAYVSCTHWLCIFGHTSYMHKACKLRCCACFHFAGSLQEFCSISGKHLLHARTGHASCVVVLACFLHACSMSVAASRANTTHAKCMQHACCIVLGLLCVSFACNAHCVVFCSVPSVCIWTCSCVWNFFPALVLLPQCITNTCKTTQMHMLANTRTQVYAACQTAHSLLHA